MIENFNNLSKNDLLYILCNSSNFSNATQRIIRDNNDELVARTELYTPVQEVSYPKDEVNRVLSLLDNDTGCKCMKEFFQSVRYTLPSESSQEVYDMIALFLISLEKMVTIDRGHNLFNQAHMSAKLFFKTILPFKLNAHYISIKSRANIIPADGVLLEYFIKGIGILIDDFIESNMNNYTAVTLIMITDYFSKYTNDKFVSRMLLAKYVYNNNEYRFSSVSIDKVKEIMSGKSNIIDIIDNIHGIDNRYLDIVKNNAKRIVEKNYTKSNVSDVLESGSIFAGDNIFSEDLSLLDVDREITVLTEGRINDYLDTDKIYYSFNESDLGYLKKREELGLCKVVRKNFNQYLLTEKDGDYFLLYGKGDNKVYGISLFEDCDNGRKQLEIDIPKNREYRLTI